MHQAGEHDMGQGGELRLDRLVDVRVPVAVAGGPPRGNAVDQFAPVGQAQAHPALATTGSGAGAVCIWV
jgi:hypothetical protein